MRRFQASTWRERNLQRHVRKHRRDFLRILGRTLSGPELRTLSREVVQSWDRLFTEVEPNGLVTYHFVRLLPAPGVAMIVVTRDAEVRTAFPSDRLPLWMHRRRAAVEVTDRAKRLGV